MTDDTNARTDENRDETNTDARTKKERNARNEPDITPEHSHPDRPDRLVYDGGDVFEPERIGVNADGEIVTHDLPCRGCWSPRGETHAFGCARELCQRCGEPYTDCPCPTVEKVRAGLFGSRSVEDFDFGEHDAGGVRGDGGGR